MKKNKKENKINKAYKFRIYPKKSQIDYIEGCFNACRYVYNISLDCEKQLYQLGAKSNLSAFGLGYHLKYYKINDTWLNNYDSLALEFEMENLSQAFDKFFKGGGYPKFKSKKDSRQSFRTRMSIKLGDGWIKIPKLKDTIKCVVHRPVEGKIQQMTISRENGKYFVSIMSEFESEQIKPISIKSEVGIDIGIQHFIITDSGNKIENPKFLSEKSIHLKKIQQRLSKSKKGSNNHAKLKLKIANLHEKIKNKRKDFLHNQSANLLKKYDRIYLETLKIKNLTKSAKGDIDNPGKNVKSKSSLNKSILDIGAYMFKNMLTYKAKFRGKEVVQVSSYFPSSKLCSSCNTKNENLKLEDRTWTCGFCGTTHDRDVNAAVNIKSEGRKFLISPPKEKKQQNIKKYV